MPSVCTRRLPTCHPTNSRRNTHYRRLEFFTAPGPVAGVHIWTPSICATVMQLISPRTPRGLDVWRFFELR
jgi:hypothetical protein